MDDNWNRSAYLHEDGRDIGTGRDNQDTNKDAAEKVGGTKGDDARQEYKKQPGGKIWTIYFYGVT